MPLNKLDHCSVRTLKLEETKICFEALGLTDSERPPFPFPGHWLYAGPDPVVHLVGIDPDNLAGLYDYLGRGISNSWTAAAASIIWPSAPPTRTA